MTGIRPDSAYARDRTYAHAHARRHKDRHIARSKSRCATQLSQSTIAQHFAASDLHVLNSFVDVLDALLDEVLMRANLVKRDLSQGSYDQRHDTCK